MFATSRSMYRHYRERTSLRAPKQIGNPGVSVKMHSLSLDGRGWGEGDPHCAASNRQSLLASPKASVLTRMFARNTSTCYNPLIRRDSENPRQYRL